ncbi:hypothetical protein B0H13DRAFT_2329628 [Mycena leptocephala]|nr:hypothetical protein B0H13DRAFT_2329628 [Mycena leptocephala]
MKEKKYLSKRRPRPPHPHAAIACLCLLLTSSSHPYPSVPALFWIFLLLAIFSQNSRARREYTSPSHWNSHLVAAAGGPVVGMLTLGTLAPHPPLGRRTVQILGRTTWRIACGHEYSYSLPLPPPYRADRRARAHTS